MILDSDAAEDLVKKLYKHILHREPRAEEFAHWVKRAADGVPPAAFIDMFYNSTEAKAKKQVPSAFPNGHYYSPVVDPKTVGDYFASQHKLTFADMAGIDISPESMLEFWEDNLDTIQSTPFAEEPQEADRFHYQGTPFPYGDAIILRAMIACHKPRRIIEAGSGYSSACMLDSADHFGLRDLDLTCIDPDTRRLRRFLRPQDYERVKILECPVQAVPLDIFASLEAGDFLFIDSTHVLKTGSDVHHELFAILPQLRKGVFVHFHDIPYPFEYSKRWVFDLNYSWNEAYALRAFLMYNSAFKVYFWNSLMRAVFPERVKTTCPIYMKNPGSGIWLRKVA